MKNLTLPLFAMMMLAMLTSCTVIETSFKAGMYWAFILVGLVIGLIIWLIMRNRGNQ